MYTLNKIIQDLVDNSYLSVAKSRKSEQGRQISLLVRFKNFSKRTVDVIWLDFNGNRVVYRTLEPNQFFDSHTGSNHQWMAVDHYDNSIQMHLTNHPIFVIDKSHLIQSVIYCFPGIQIPITEKLGSLQQITERFLSNYLCKHGMTFNDLAIGLNPMDVPKNLLKEAYINQCLFPIPSAELYR